MVKSLRLTTLFVVAVNTLFCGLDYLSQPESFGHLLAIRMAWNLVMLTVFGLASRFDTYRMLQVGVMASGFALIALIAAAGGLSGSYWPGIMILFVGIPVFLPVSGKQAATMVGVLLPAFAVIPFFSGESLDLGSYVAPVFFASAAAFECVASSALLDRLRLAEFVQRREIENARDELRDLDRAKSRFTANIHHELRTPLTLTLAPLESLMAGDFGPVSAKQREYMKTMHVNALRLLKLINNLLDLAKIESEQLEIVRRPVDIGLLVDDICSGARPMAEKKDIALVAGSPPGSLVVNADCDAIEKVLINLLGNALKFTDSGGRIEVSSRPDGAGVLLQVVDDGLGLATTDVERIFDRFAQADGSATRQHEGTGIGLSLSKELVELHGGRIWAESDGPGRGAAFKVWIPEGAEDSVSETLLADQPTSKTVDDGLGALSAEIESSSADDLRMTDLARSADRWVKQREEDLGTDPDQANLPEVLICEDNADMRKLLAHVLSAEFQVRLAPNGRRGLEAVNERVPDLVLTDVMMPEMSGIDLCKALKQEERTAGVPVVLVTSKAEREMKIEGLEIGADDYVTKPFHARELLARVRSLVRLRQLQATLADRNNELEQANCNLEQALSELKETEAQLVLTERLAAVGELAAGIAHEANNPVNFALNALRAMRDYVDDLRAVGEEMLQIGNGSGSWDAVEKLQGRMGQMEFETIPSSLLELSEIVEEGLERTGRLVGDLRDFAAPRDGRHVRMDLVRTLDSSRQLLRHSFQERSIDVKVCASADLPYIVGDPQAIGQVFLNILKNASEALETQGGNIWIDLSLENHGVRVAIRDDGPGIADSDCVRLFQPFFTTKGPGKGTGLGLSISQKAIEEHGGTISVKTQLGTGTEFVIWLPAEATDEA